LSAVLLRLTATLTATFRYCDLLARVNSNADRPFHPLASHGCESLGAE